MSNRIQLRRSSTPSSIPTLGQLMEGELSVNLADKDFYYSTGSEVVQLNAALNIRTDATHRFVTDTNITDWGALATDASVGRVQVGTNLQVDVNGVISLQAADSTHTGALTSADWATFNGKQDAIGYTPVNKAGDTMLGTLVLSGAPSGANDATTKTYVDDADGLKLDLAGGTMSGLLVLSGDPAANLGAATKQYVDGAVGLISGKYAPPVADITALSALVSTTLEDRQMRLVESPGAIFRYDEQSTDTPDGVGVVIPDDITAPAPGRWIKIQTATQNHNSLTGLQGGAANDYLHLTTTEKNSYDSHLTDATIHLTSAQNTWIDAINASSTEVNYLVGVTSSVQDQLDGKQSSLGFTPVNINGDTMTGLLILSGDPTNVLGAATKQYVDNLVVDGGTY